MAGSIRAGIGGWTFEPWRGTFYPVGLAQSRELAYASRAVASIEINGTFYSTFKPDIWRRWHDEAPDGFVFSVKGSRYVTSRRNLADAGTSLERFMAQGLTELGPKLGPIVWQLAATKSFVPDEIDSFLSLLARHHGGLEIRHAIEVRHPSFDASSFVDLAAKHNVAIVLLDDEDAPRIDQPTTDFTYARIKTVRQGLAEGLSRKDMRALVDDAERWAARGDVFVYFIAGDKVRNPAAAQAFLRSVTDKRNAPIEGAKTGRQKTAGARGRIGF